MQVLDLDAERVERFLRHVALAKAHEGDVEARLVEPRDHPCEQALDAVHAGTVPPEVIADLQHVERPPGIRSKAHTSTPGDAGSRLPTTRAGMPTAMALAGMSPRTTAPAPTIAPSPMVAPSSTFTPAPSHPPAPIATPFDERGWSRI